MKNAESVIPIFFACDDNYAVHTCVAILSILDNSSSKFRFFVLHSNLSEKSQNAISQAAGKEEMNFYKVDMALFEKFDVVLKHLTREACFRYLIPIIEPDMKRALYLDCDIIALDDVKKLFELDISGSYAGAIEDFIDKSHFEKFGLDRYFDSGVLVLDLEMMRKDNITQKLFEESDRLNGISKFLDQDALNIAFKGKTKFLPLKWNVSSPVFRKKVKYLGNPAEVDEALDSPAIVQFTGPDKPWEIPYGAVAHPYTPLYFHYLRKTAFKEMEKTIFKNFDATGKFLWYFKRHLFFFLRPTYFRMRKIYKANFRKYASK